MNDMELRFRVTAQMGEAKAALDQGAAAFRDFGDRAQAAMRTASAGQTMLNNSSANTANIAAQFQDIGVMLAAGQNPFQLAIQQGSQLAQVLNQTGGGVRGVVSALRAGFMSLISPTTLLTVAIIAGGSALVQWVMNAGEAVSKSEELKDKIDELSKSIDELKAAESDAAEPMDKLVQKYGELAGAVRDARQQIAAQAADKARDGLKDLIGGFSDALFVPSAEDIKGFDDILTKVDDLNQKMQDARNKASQDGTFYDETADRAQLDDLMSRAQASMDFLRGLRDEMGLTRDQAQLVGVAMTEMLDADTAVAQVQAAQKLSDTLIKVFGSAKAADDATNGMVTALAIAIEKGADLASVTGDVGTKTGDAADMAKAMQNWLKLSWDAANGLKGTAPDATWLSSAISQAFTLWDLLKKANAARLAAMQSPYTKPDANGEVVDRSQWDSGSMGRGLPSDYQTQIDAVFNPVVPAVENTANGVGRALDDMVQEAKPPLQELADQMAKSLTDPLADFIKGTASAKDAGTRFLDAIKNKLIEVAMQEAQTNLFSPLLGQLFGGLQGSGFGKSILSAFGVANTAAVAAPSAGAAIARAAAPLRTAMALPVDMGKVAGKGDGGNVVVNIHTPPGHTATVQQSQSGSMTMIDAVVEQIEARLGDNLRRGTGAQAAVLEASYGLRRRPR